MIPQRKRREILVQLLYSASVDRHQDVRATLALLSALTLDEAGCQKIIDAMGAISLFWDQIDELITDAARDYEVQRISRVECAALRLALFELCYEKKTPPKVIIAEAVRISRKFGTKEGGAFVNAVLDAVARKKGACLTTDVAQESSGKETECRVKLTSSEASA